VVDLPTPINRSGFTSDLPLGEKQIAARQQLCVELCCAATGASTQSRLFQDRIPAGDLSETATIIGDASAGATEHRIPQFADVKSVFRPDHRKVRQVSCAYKPLPHSRSVRSGVPKIHIRQRSAHNRLPLARLANWDLSVFKSFPVRERVTYLSSRKRRSTRSIRRSSGRPNTAVGNSNLARFTPEATFPRYLQLGGKDYVMIYAANLKRGKVKQLQRL